MRQGGFASREAIVKNCGQALPPFSAADVDAELAALVKDGTLSADHKAKPVKRRAKKRNPAPAMSAKEGRRFKAEVANANDKTLRALARAKVKELRLAVKAARKRGPLRTAEVRAILKRTRELVRAGARAEGVGAVARAKKELEIERADQATQKRLERANRARAKMRPLAKAKERASENDGEVEGNLPAEFVPLWRKVKKSIRGNARKSRTEAFLEYVAENPGEVIDAAPGIDSEIAELERRANAAQDFSRKAKYSAADFSAPPF